jgi:membrane protease YdiL (CAAX protease family)
MDQPRPQPTWTDLAITAVALSLPTAITWAYFFGAERAATGVQLGVFSVVKVVQFALPILWVALVQKGGATLRPPGWRGAPLGVAFGLAVAAAMFGLYHGVLKGSAALAAAEPQIRAKVDGFGVDSTAEFVALAAFYSLIHSLLEEYYWRWFVYGQLRRFAAVRTAAVVSALGFMAHHVLVLGKFFGFASPTTYLLSACIAVGGAVWAWLYERTGSLLGPWISHAIVDAAIFAVGFAIVRPLLAG